MKYIYIYIYILTHSFLIKFLEQSRINNIRDPSPAVNPLHSYIQNPKTIQNSRKFITKDYNIITKV
jgi:hypothetical protein